MALKPVYDKQDQIPQPLREHYVEEDGRFVLQHDGEHPALAKVAEFRTNNVAMKRELDELRPLKTKFEGIDPSVVAAERAELAELRPLKAKVAGLDLDAARAALTENAALKAAASEAEAKAKRVQLRAVIESKALAAGAFPKGAGMLTDKLMAEDKFFVEGDSVKAKPGLFSPDRPGEPLTVEDWLRSASREYSFAFKPSSGSGSVGSGSASETSSVRVLRNPTEKQLGAAATDILKGRVRVEHDAQ